MPLKELLLNSSNFTEVLNQYAVNPADFCVKDEDLIFSRLKSTNEGVFRETIVIEGLNDKGRICLIGAMYGNFDKNIAVFELESAEYLKGDTVLC